MAYRFTPADRAAFKRCRRQWDFGARERQNLEPAEAAAAPGQEQAVRDALAVYYFPGMVEPPPAAAGPFRPADSPVGPRPRTRHPPARGQRRRPVAALCPPRRRPSPAARPGAGADRGRRGVPAHPDPRDRAELEAVGVRLAAEALDMVDPGLRLYPNPAPEHCGGCPFVAPCLAMERGQEAAAVLQAGYRDPGPERVESGRLGAATWGTGRGAAPPRFDRG